MKDFELMKSIIENSDRANDGLKTARLILNSLSDMDMGKFMGEMRKACLLYPELLESLIECRGLLFVKTDEFDAINRAQAAIKKATE